MPAASTEPLILPTDRGLYCPAGDFHIDPWRPVERAIITHGHSDHARHGSHHYLAAQPGLLVLRERLGHDANLTGVPYGQRIDHGDVTVSLYPAGHLLGSAQVRVEHRGRVAVVSGDYKLEPDPTCTPFEPVPCHEFITECTFGLPIYRWRPQATVIDQIHAWWRDNLDRGRTSVLFAYALGKAQRVLALLDASIGPIVAHGAVHKLVEVYREAGVALPEVQYANEETRKQVRGRGLVVAPPSALGTPWLRKFAPLSTGYVSGWMQVRGARRWRSVDRGFALSGHIDWPGLLATIDATGAERIGLTHGYTSAVHRWLTEQGRDAYILPTRFTGEHDPAGDETDKPAGGPTSPP